jgi:hypothetical protein
VPAAAPPDTSGHHSQTGRGSDVPSDRIAPICDPSGPRSPRSTRSAQQLDAGAADLYFMSDLESAGAQLDTELILAMLAARVPLMLLPDLAGFAKPAVRSDFTAADRYC